MDDPAVTTGKSPELRLPPSAAGIVQIQLIAEVQKELLSQIAAFGIAIGKLQKVSGGEQQESE
jgi:hypothetical protein